MVPAQAEAPGQRLDTVARRGSPPATGNRFIRGRVARRLGTWLATGGIDGTVRLWAADATPRGVLTGHHGTVTAVAIAPDGTWLATTSDDDTVRIWAADGTPRGVLTSHHGGPVRAVAIAPDGTWLATASGDRTVRIWAADGSSRSSATAIRVDGAVWGCAWFPGSTDLCISGIRGLYRFSLQPPPT